MRIQINDTTLRDGTQSESVVFSVEDKLRVARKLDELGVDYIEGGWPGSNDKDAEFFRRARHITWQRAKMAAFGSTAHYKNTPEDDFNILEASHKALADGVRYKLRRDRQSVQRRSSGSPNAERREHL